MAYLSQHTLLTFRGKQFTTEEDWAFGLRFYSTTPLTQAMADSCAAAGKTWITTASSGYSAQTTLVAAKVAPIATNGLYVPGAIAYESFPSSAVGSFGSAVVHPPQIALAMTLVSAIPRGPGHQTHVFLPGPHFPLATASLAQISAGNNAAVLANFKVLINTLNPLFGGPLHVMSQKYARSEAVTTLKCGRAFDTMRSRRTSIPESYDTLAL